MKTATRIVSVIIVLALATTAKAQFMMRRAPLQRRVPSVQPQTQNGYRSNLRQDLRFAPQAKRTVPPAPPADLYRVPSMGRTVLPVRSRNVVFPVQPQFVHRTVAPPPLPAPTVRLPRVMTTHATTTNISSVRPHVPATPVIVTSTPDTATRTVAVERTVSGEETQTARTTETEIVVPTQTQTAQPMPETSVESPSLLKSVLIKHTGKQ